MSVKINILILITAGAVSIKSWGDLDTPNPYASDYTERIADTAAKAIPSRSPALNPSQTNLIDGCADNVDGLKLPEENFCTLCFSEGEEWENYNIAKEYDEKFKENGWTPKQAAFAVRLLLNNNTQNKEILKITYHILSNSTKQNSDTPFSIPFRSLEDVNNFITYHKKQLEEKDNTDGGILTICSELYGGDALINITKCEDIMRENWNNWSIDKTTKIWNEICKDKENDADKDMDENEAENKNTKTKCCDTNKDSLHAIIEQDTACSDDSTKRLPTEIETEFGKCNPFLCCLRQDADASKVHELIPKEKECADNSLRDAADAEKREGFCNEGAAEAAADCIDCAARVRKNLIDKLKQTLEETTSAQQTLIQEIEKQKKETGTEYKRRKKKRDKDKKLAEDIDDCINKEGEWTRLASDSSLCRLLKRIHSRQDQMAQMQDYNQGVQQQLWTAVKNQSMNAFSHYESISRMMQSGFFNSPYPQRNLQFMNQLNSMQNTIDRLQLTVDQNNINTRFNSLAGRMDQIVGHNAAGRYHSDEFYQTYRRDLLGSQQIIENLGTPTPVLR